MADDYFQDLTDSDTSSNAAPKPVPPTEAATPERSIRNVNVSINRSAARPKMEPFGSDMRPPQAPTPLSNSPMPRRGRGFMKYVLIVVGAVILLSAGAALFFTMSGTQVTVTPRSQTVVFNEASTFTATPSATTAVPGTLTYTVETTEAEDSEVVAANGTEQVQEKASGKITVVNQYSTDPVRLIKNTRFETPDGKVFRVAESIVVPGKTAAKPGELVVTVFADQPGESYNIGPVAKFTLPGLKGTPDMYATMSARSEAAMTGGFSGSRPAVAAATLEQARAQIRARLETRVREAATTRSNESMVVFASLARITYTSLPHTQEAGGSVRVHEKAEAKIPVFQANTFGTAVARVMSADAGESSVKIVPLDNFMIKESASSTAGSLGLDPIVVTLGGSAQIVWDVDTDALATALAGKDKANFLGIIATFPGIDSATTSALPFWKGSFPKDPVSINIEIKASNGN